MSSAKAMQDDSVLLPQGSHTMMLRRLARDTLVWLAVKWLDDVPLCIPHSALIGDEGEADDSTPQIIGDIRDLYISFQDRNVPRKTVVERMIYVDWVRGFNMQQAADIEFQHIFEKQNALKWTASRVSIVSPNSGVEDSSKNERLPAFHVPAFMRTLKKSLQALIGNHLHIAQHPSLSLIILRISLHDRNFTRSGLPAPRRVVFVAFPTAPLHLFHTPFISPYYKILKQCIEASLSFPGLQVRLLPTSLTAKSLATLVHLRTTSRSSTALGGWSVYANDAVDHSPLASAEEILQKKIDETVKEDIEEIDEEAKRERKRLKTIDARFGVTAPLPLDEEEDGDLADEQQLQELVLEDSLALTHVEFRLEDDHVDSQFDEAFTTKTRVLIEGTHVFEGMRRLARKGLVDEQRMPAWVTGELGVSVGVIVNGVYVAPSIADS
ncbi:centromere protein Chl4/mis15/CENP-N [Myxozyma melibiosi]|uniref:Centromere protein Chl4/mis15/CENP-N n=1 Tax=Myxozyma melibiosi TaxID=54550 RepID=A0ABR1FEZ4_9ASCO